MLINLPRNTCVTLYTANNELRTIKREKWNILWKNDHLKHRAFGKREKKVARIKMVVDVFFFVTNFSVTLLWGANNVTKNNARIKILSMDYSAIAVNNMAKPVGILRKKM